jgi:phosphodiesterase/alkaline phosphatase D-like protein
MKIAFASCSRIQEQYNPPEKLKPEMAMPFHCQPVWGTIQNEQPDTLILLGDNVYPGTGRWTPVQLKEQYIWQNKEIHFKRLKESVSHFFATWDDHDFQFNNAYGAEIDTEHKDHSRCLFRKYITDVRDNYPDIYCSKTIGRVKIIVLDTRYHREAPACNATLLGQVQEDWLLKELKDPGYINIICSGSVFCSFADPSTTPENGQSWTYYPGWCKRFFDAVKLVPRLLFLGGDIHVNNFRKHPLPSYAVTLDGNAVYYPPGYSQPPFYECISSGVGRNFPDTINPRNNYGIIDIGEKFVTIHLRGEAEHNKRTIKIHIRSWKIFPSWWPSWLPSWLLY